MKHTHLANYNDLVGVKALFDEHGQDIAAIFVEPVAGNMGLVLPEAGFLQGLRDLATQHGALLVFDEVITGFRVAFGGAQSVFGITPDLTCLGKIIGGGLLCAGAYGGKKEIMAHIAPSGNVYQAGTLSGNSGHGCGPRDPQRVGDPRLRARALMRFQRNLRIFCAPRALPVHRNHIASIFTLFFTETPVRDFPSAKTADATRPVLSADARQGHLSCSIRI